MSRSTLQAILVGLFTLGALLLQPLAAQAHLSIIRQGTESAGFREDGELFGSSVAYGDFNGDNRDDLATGSPWEGAGSPRLGQVTISYGSAEGLTHVVATFLNPGDFGLNLNAEMRFGQVLAVSDLNRDGYDDLVVGTPGEIVNGASQVAGS